MIPVGRLALAGVLSAAVPWLGAPFDGLSRVALVLWPWMVILGTPCAAHAADRAGVPRGAADRRGMAPAAALGLSLPALGLAFALDRAAGLSASDLLALLIPGAVLVILFAGLAGGACRRPRTRTAHGILWTCGVLGLPLLATAVAWGFGPAAYGGAHLRRAAALSPLCWLHGHTVRASLRTGTGGGRERRPLAPGVPHRGELELVGPLDVVQILSAGGGTTHLDLNLIAGERETRSVLLAPRLAGPGAAWPTVLSSPGAGRATWTGDIRPSAGEVPLPPGLRSRPWPPVAPAAIRPRTVALASLVAAILLLCSLRRHPGSTLLLGLAAGGGLACWGVIAPTSSGVVIEVLEGDLEAGAWTRVLSARGSLVLGNEVPTSLKVDPPDAPLDLMLAATALVPGGLGRGGPDPAGWRAVSEPAACIRARFSSGGLSLDPTVGPPVPLEDVWVRGRAGSWTRRGTWGPGEPLPAPETASRGVPEGLPGWLTGALPPGQTILVARRPGRSAWIRVSGLSL